MTYQANITKYPTKTALRKAIREDPSKVYLHDPSIVGNFSGMVDEILKIKPNIVVTNHPKRSWFASITIALKGKHKGKVIVK